MERRIFSAHRDSSYFTLLGVFADIEVSSLNPQTSWETPGWRNWDLSRPHCLFSKAVNPQRHKACQLWNVKQDISELLSFAKDYCPLEGSLQFICQDKVFQAFAEAQFTTDVGLISRVPQLMLQLELWYDQFNRGSIIVSYTFNKTTISAGSLSKATQNHMLIWFCDETPRTRADLCHVENKDFKFKQIIRPERGGCQCERS